MIPKLMPFGIVWLLFAPHLYFCELYAQKIIHLPESYWTTNAQILSFSIHSSDCLAYAYGSDWDQGIAIYQPENPAYVQHISIEGIATSPEWSKDGGLFFSWKQHETYQLMLYQPERDTLFNYFDRDIEVRQAASNKDGSMLVLTGKSTSDNYWQLYTYHTIYDNLNPIARQEGTCLDPQWSPDGKKILYLVKTQQYKLVQTDWYGDAHKEFPITFVEKPCFLWSVDSWKFFLCNNDTHELWSTNIQNQPNYIIKNELPFVLDMEIDDTDSLFMLLKNDATNQIIKPSIRLH